MATKKFKILQWARCSNSRQRRITQLLCLAPGSDSQRELIRICGEKGRSITLAPSTLKFAKSTVAAN